MGSIHLAAAALLAASGTGAAAADWRAVGDFGREIAFVDADSVERRADGRLSFSARFLLADKVTFSDAGYDRYDVRAIGHCSSDAEETPVEAHKAFYLRDSKTEAPDWNEEDVDRAIALTATTLCEGRIGYRTFASPEAAMTEYDDHRSAEQLAAYVSDEVELTGTVVQGFEMNGIALCGSEAGCTSDAPIEFCWLEGNISVPVPAGADPNSIRRDTADVVVHGRILRSRWGRGFGHVRAHGCLVQATGPARFITLPPRTTPRQPERGEIGRTGPAMAAHAALDSAFAEVGAVTAEQDGHKWSIDALKARPSDWEAACGSDLEYQGRSLDPYPTAIMWNWVNRIGVEGPVLTIFTERWNGFTEFHLGTPAAAEAVAAMVERLRDLGVEAVAQKGRQVTLRLAGGKEFVETYPSAALAIEAAGIADALRRQKIASVSRKVNKVTAMLERRVVLTFEDEAKAREIAGHLEKLRQLCSAPLPQA